MNVSLKEFIETGRFGPVHLGMNRAQVERSLGAPDDVGWGSRKHRQPAIWKYGDVEFHFGREGDALFLIHLDEFDVPSGGKFVGLDPWVIRGSLTLLEAEKYLTRNGIDYEVADYPLEDDALCIKTGAGVKLIFIGERLPLRAVSYLDPAT